MEINKLDSQITEILIGAEKKCTTVRSHHLDDWTPELMEAPEKKRACKTLLTKASKITLESNLIESIETFRSASQDYELANTSYLKMKRDSKQKRTTFQMELAKEKAAQRGTDAAKEIKSLIHIEKQRNQSLRINSVLKPRSGGGPSSIMIPALSEYQQPYPKNFSYREIEFIWQRIEYDNGEDVVNWERITDQKLVESMLLSWQQRHFMEANETPFASDFWRKELQQEEVQNEILNGTYEPPVELPLEAKEILQEMKRPSEVKGESVPEATLNDFKIYKKKIHEKRSSSPSGRHYGHYKVLMTSDSRYLQVIHGILALSLKNCIVLKRWKRTVTSLIEKKQGTPFIHKFRVIHIIEGDLQFLARFYYARQMMRYAEDNGLITDQQYGGRKGRMAQ